MTEGWLERAIAAADRANAEDPRRVVVDGAERSFELHYADRLQRWVAQLVRQPSPELRFAARAQHLRRWEIPRATYPEGREAYLRWRRDLASHHVAKAREILAASGAPDGVAERVERILRKRGLGRDADAQAMEDALCLVTLELQLTELGAKLDRPKLVDVLAKTWAKMSPAGRALAATIPVDLDAASVLAEAAAAAPGAPARGS